MIKNALFLAIVLGLVATSLLSCSQPFPIVATPTPTPIPTAMPSCWSAAQLSNAGLASLVIQHFPDGTVPQTGENIRVTAYAVARAESGGNPSACGDNNQSIGLWQIYMPAHLQYSKESLFDPDTNAEAARAISNNGQDWNAWCTWETSACNGNGNEAYKAYLAEARLALGISPATSGLANSPWPMFAHDPQHTGKSPNSGTPTPILEWRYPTDGAIHSSPSIGTDGTIYFGSNGQRIYALNPDGSLKWSYATGYFVSSSPAIGADGTVYIGCHDGNLYALYPNGYLKWKYTTGNWILASPTIGADGTVYVGSEDGNLYALYPNGNLKWKYTTGGPVGSSAAIGTDGTVYFGSDDKSLYAIDAGGYLKWKYPIGCPAYSPSIGADGTIYVGGSCDNTLYALNPTGSLKWRYSAGYWISSTPAIGEDHTIYFGSWDNNLYAINVNGTLKWKYITGSSISGSPIIGADGTIYVGSNDARLYAINPDGSLKWNYTTGSSIHYTSPAIGADGSLYVGLEDGNFCAIGSRPPTPTPSLMAMPTASPTSALVNVDDSFSGKQVQLSVGQLLVLTLASNATTGYSWTLAQNSDESVLAKIENKYIAPQTTLIGAGGKEEWTFKALKTDISIISMEYRRPWETDTPPAQTFDLTVVVR